MGYTTVAGSATSGSDFTPATGTLMFAPGETTKSISVSIMDDSIDETNESIAVIISSSVKGMPAAATGTIIDNADSDADTDTDTDTVRCRESETAVCSEFAKAPRPSSGR